MGKYYVTFPDKYKLQRHPMFSGAHPDGIVQINASSEDAARKVAEAALGTKEWSFLGDKNPSRENYPLGIIAVWSGT